MKRFFVPVAAIMLAFSTEACAQPYGFYEYPANRPFVRPFARPFARPFVRPVPACPPVVVAPPVVVPQRGFFAPAQRGFGRSNNPYCAPRRGWGRRW